MTDITPNYLHIYRDRRGKHITLDGHELLLDGEDPLLITGVENQEEITRVMLTLLAPKITIDPETEDQEPETATVDAPAPTIAEGLRDLARTLANLAINSGIEDLTSEELNRLIDRAEQIEQERDQARAEVGRLNADLDAMIKMVDSLNDDMSELRGPQPTSVHPSDQQANTQGILAGSLPDPADVKPGEAWIVNIDGVEIVPGFKASVGWICYRFFGGTTKAIGDERITLVSRLVPAPRVITNPDEAWNLPISTIIRDSRGETFERTEDGWGRISVPVKAIKWPVTVLWTPEEKA